MFVSQYLGHFYDALPVWLGYWEVWVGILCVAFIVYLYVVTDRPPKFNLAGKHVLISGGSSGIGLACAIQAAKEGAHVSIFARKEPELRKAAEMIKNARVSKKQVVQYLSINVTDDKILEVAIEAFSLQKTASAPGSFGRPLPPDVLVCSAGMSKPAYVEDLSANDNARLLNVNVLGTMNCVNAVLPYMKAIDRKTRKPRGGRIVLVSSMAGLTGIIGFTGYSASKFAVRGYAEALHMEVRPHNVYVSVCNPPDVDTPMLHAENKCKPVECKRISEGSGLFRAEHVAKGILSAVKRWRFFVQTGFDGHLIGILCAGMAPSSGILQSMMEILFGGIIRAVSLGYLWSFNRICTEEHERRTRPKSH